MFTQRIDKAYFPMPEVIAKCKKTWLLEVFFFQNTPLLSAMMTYVNEQLLNVKQYSINQTSKMVVKGSALLIII